MIEIIYKNLKSTKNKDVAKKPLIYNLNSLYNLSRGNKDFVIRMIQIFINQTNETIIKIEDALQVDNFEEISRLIHKIKPSIEGVGVFHLLNEVKELEKISKMTTDKVAIENLFNTIKEGLLIAIEQLQKNELQ